ncbi:hypothetical protein [Prosthecobacter dejongeii]|uniref:Flavodoxin n=1 Tax=Prosthecobacter dejongeii TaxID=48465 RepID=A0A7W7YL80_9BACT|nr:hypothetical protein [Prosthecobacter dejongeii]MBB5038233.1 flavodoxin [Prosthecobacter dejongeii]
MKKEEFDKLKGLPAANESQLILGSRVAGTGKLEFLDWDDLKESGKLKFTPTAPLNVRLEGKGEVTYFQHRIEFKAATKSGEAYYLLT